MRSEACIRSMLNNVSVLAVYLAYYYCHLYLYRELLSAIFFYRRMIVRPSLHEARQDRRGQYCAVLCAKDYVGAQNVEI